MKINRASVSAHLSFARLGASSALALEPLPSALVWACVCSLPLELLMCL